MLLTRSGRVLLSLALFRLGYALRRDRRVFLGTEPSLRDVREIARAAEAAGLALPQSQRA